MNDENWPVEWLRQLKRDVDFFAKMVYATRTEIKSSPLKRVRKDMEEMLKQGVWNRTVSSQEIISWIKQIRKKLEYAELQLDLTAEIIGKNESSTRMAAKRAHRLVARIDSSIGLVEKALNEKG
jgi:tRNA A37 methylthiotransferase MiaB